MADTKFVPPGFGMLLLLSTCSAIACAAIALCILELFPSDGGPLGLLSERAAWVLLVVAVAALLACVVKQSRIQQQRRAATPPPEVVAKTED
jgi:hypothetical protein